MPTIFVLSCADHGKTSGPSSVPSAPPGDPPNPLVTRLLMIEACDCESEAEPRKIPRPCALPPLPPVPGLETTEPPPGPPLPAGAGVAELLVLVSQMDPELVKIPPP